MWRHDLNSSRSHPVICDITPSDIHIKRCCLNCTECLASNYVNGWLGLCTVNWTGQRGKNTYWRNHYTPHDSRHLEQSTYRILRSCVNTSFNQFGNKLQTQGRSFTVGHIPWRNRHYCAYSQMACTVCVCVCVGGGQSTGKIVVFGEVKILMMMNWIVIHRRSLCCALWWKIKLSVLYLLKKRKVICDTFLWWRTLLYVVFQLDGPPHLSLRVRATFLPYRWIGRGEGEGEGKVVSVLIFFHAMKSYWVSGGIAPLIWPRQ